MKKVILLVAISSLLSTLLFAQVTPEGMNYQAVARNLRGEILASQPISLKVKLFSVLNSGKVEYYNEVHDVTTSITGVFSLIIGKGKSETGKYNTIPWSSENIWMEVSIKSKDQYDFVVMSNSKLLAVPYAYHSLTAERIAGTTNSVTSTTTSGTPSQSWLLFGNSASNPTKDNLGTTDSVDLKVITNNQERLRIFANGDINIKKNLRINAKLTVDSSAFLNKIGGSTINYGPFTVDRQSPTLLSGTLTVDKATDLNSSLNVDGITDLNSRLNVNNNSAAVLTGTLRVDGITDLNSALNVNNISPTLLTGTLRVNKDALFKEKVYLDNSTHQSTSVSTGALVVNGGFGLGGNLNVGGESNFGGPVQFGSTVKITDLTQSTSPTTGALIVSGGVGIGKRLNVGEGGMFESTLGAKGLVNFTNITESTLPGNGAFILAGGAGIAKNLNVGGNFTLTGIANLNNTLNVTASGTYIANFINSTSANGLSIQIAAPTPSTSNNFITFKNSNGDAVGTIEGQTLTELHNSDDYKDELAGRVYDVTAGVIDLLFASVDLGMAISHNIGAAASVNVCAGLGVVACPPIISLIAASAVNLGLAIAQEIVVIADVVFASVNLAKFVQNQDAQVGISYTSGSGDYAEYLVRADVNEKIVPGDIVGIRGGMISKNTAGADRVMVVSHKPIVLGNVPPAGTEINFEKVAFMGQVPVKVFGAVKLGDYIIPNDVNNGVGKAISPDKITSKQIKSIVGIAWSEAKDPMQISMVNVGVGLNVNDNQKLVDELTKEISDLKNEFASTNQQLEKLIPGFKNNGTVSTAVVANVPAPVATAATPQDNPYSKIPYHKVVAQDILNGFDYAEKAMREKGIDVDTHAFFVKCKKEPAYKKMLVDQLVVKFNVIIEEQKKINEAKAVQINNLRPEN